MMVYMPYWHRADTSGWLAMRTRQDPATKADAIRKAVSGVDGDVSVPAINTLGDNVGLAICLEKSGAFSFRSASQIREFGCIPSTAECLDQ
jgi:hypothetical protein